MQRLFVLPSVDSSFYRVAIRGDEARGRVPQNGLKARRRFSTVSSTVREFLARKTAQFCCKPHSLGLPMMRNAVQHSENVRNSLVLNYKSATHETKWRPFAVSTDWLARSRWFSKLFDEYSTNRIRFGAFSCATVRNGRSTSPNEFLS
jgi:hypothetical protein